MKSALKEYLEISEHNWMDVKELLSHKNVYIIQGTMHTEVDHKNEDTLV